LISDRKAFLGPDPLGGVPPDCRVGTLESRNTKIQGAPPEPGRSEGNRKTILIVDDDETILHLLRRFFAREGFRVSIAKDGVEAIERLKEESPAVLLTDLKMPSLAGTELIQFVRKNGIRTAVVVMTAYPEEWSGNDIGACFTKPFDLDEIFSAIRGILGV